LYMTKYKLFCHVLSSIVTSRPPLSIQRSVLWVITSQINLYFWHRSYPSLPLFSVCNACIVSPTSWGLVYNTKPDCFYNQWVVPSVVVDILVRHDIIIWIVTIDAIKVHMFLGKWCSELVHITSTPFQMIYGVDVGVFGNLRISSTVVLDHLWYLILTDHKQAWATDEKNAPLSRIRVGVKPILMKHILFIFDMWYSGKKTYSLLTNQDNNTQYWRWEISRPFSGVWNRFSCTL
jgi:hypothetical protein